MENGHQGILGHLEAAIKELALALAKAQSLDATDGKATLLNLAGIGGEEYLSVRQLAARIPYSEQTIRNLMSAGEFQEGVHYYKKRRRVMFRWSQVEQWLRDHADRSEAEEPFYPVHHARTRKT